MNDDATAATLQPKALVPNHIYRSVLDVFPQTLTLLVSYKCNAECAQCCFESNPRIKERLSLDEIRSHITAAKASFPALKIVVFSGGECFLIKEDLYKAISTATELGLMTRCVTNGFWGKTERNARRVVEHLVGAGLSEINFSTGSDHQEWVPFSSVENAARATVEAGIRTVVTIEADSETSDCVGSAARSTVFKELAEKHPGKFSSQTNTWMPFNNEWDESRSRQSRKPMGGCEQVFGNTVVTPHNLLSACCGLTLEHIPEMKIADLRETQIAEGFTSQFDDFLKIWIHVDGPSGILQKLFPDSWEQLIGNSVHICQACAILHQHPQVRTALSARFLEFVPEVLARFNAKVTIAHQVGKFAAARPLNHAWEAKAAAARTLAEVA